MVQCAMTGTASIVENASAAAKAVLAQLVAPTSQCCTAGTLAFAESERVVAAENAIALAELTEAQTVLAAEAEISLAGFIAAEAALQRSVGNKNFPTIAANLMLAESTVTEDAFLASEVALAEQISEATFELHQAEAFLSAEAHVFAVAGGCEPTPGISVSPAIINTPALVGAQTIALPAGKLVSVVATAQSSGTQTVSITDPSSTVVFSASGASSSGGTFTQIGQGTFTSVAGTYTINLTAGAGILASAMSTNFGGSPYLTTYTFATNDGGASAGDRDFNDLVVTIQVYANAG